MGDVVPFAAMKCSCGWMYPAALMIVVSTSIRDEFSILLTCPVCKRQATTMTVRDVEEKPS